MADEPVVPVLGLEIPPKIPDIPPVKDGNRGDELTLTVVVVVVVVVGWESNLFTASSAAFFSA